MGAVRKRKKVKAYMEDVMVVDLATWHRLGAEQKAAKERIEFHEQTIVMQGRKEAELENQLDESEQTIKDLRGDNHHLEKVIKDLEERLKFESNRLRDAIMAFNNVSEAAAYTAQVSLKMVRLMDDLDLEFTIREKKR
jgi:hypothetical protein